MKMFLEFYAGHPWLGTFCLVALVWIVLALSLAFMLGRTRTRSDEWGPDPAAHNGGSDADIRRCTLLVSNLEGSHHHEAKE